MTVPDEEADRLAGIAAQLAGRVRDDDPARNAAWLRAVTSGPEDWFKLCHVLAAAVPVDTFSWRQLTAWTRLPAERLDWANGATRLLRPCGTWAAAKRHRYRKEPLCGLCREAERAYARDAGRRRLQRERVIHRPVDVKPRAALRETSGSDSLNGCDDGRGVAA